jgi:tetratricopeptide (TPR) repeat protein
MTHIPRSRRRPSFVYALGERTPGQRALNALVNRYEQAFADRDRAEMARLRRALRYSLADFERRDGDEHSRPEWIRPVMRANVLACLGRLEDALAEELRGEGQARCILADDPEDAMARVLLAKSRSNVSDHLRRLGRPAEAVAAAREAATLWPENPGVVVNLAMALYRDGRPQLCGPIFHDLIAAARLDDPTDIVRAHALFEGELRDMTDVPEVRRLLASVGTLR